MALQNKKSLGQHWLRDREILELIADFSIDTPDEPLPVCLEIGPGLGTLTSSLLRRYDKVIAVEFDERLAKNLPKSFPGKNLEVINADFLDFDLTQVEAPYSVVGNIPYYITSPIIRKLLETENRPSRIVLLIQKEVAERIAVAAGDHTYLSLFVQNRAEVMLGPVVQRELFTPPPKVDSKIIVLDPHDSIISSEALKLAKIGFSSPRKKLIKNLAHLNPGLEAIFAELKISPNARPSDLSLETWQKLENALAKTKHKR